MSLAQLVLQNTKMLPALTTPSLPLTRCSIQHRAMWCHFWGWSWGQAPDTRFWWVQATLWDLIQARVAPTLASFLPHGGTPVSLELPNNSALEGPSMCCCTLGC